MQSDQTRFMYTVWIGAVALAVIYAVALFH